MTNIRTALFPLLFLLCLCGFGVFEYQGQPRLRLTVLYILAMWLLHVYVMVKTKRLLDTFTLDFPLIMKVSVVFTVMYMLIILYYYKVKEFDVTVVAHSFSHAKVSCCRQRIQSEIARSSYTYPSSDAKPILNRCKFYRIVTARAVRHVYLSARFSADELTTLARNNTKADRS